MLILCYNSIFLSSAKLQIALISLGKQDPPKPGPASRNLLPILESNPKAYDNLAISPGGGGPRK
jgi:hypothetical protein